jgi:hypothetical protein
MHKQTQKYHELITILLYKFVIKKNIQSRKIKLPSHYELPATHFL